jgi:hypothetical protein
MQVGGDKRDIDGPFTATAPLSTTFFLSLWHDQNRRIPVRGKALTLLSDRLIQ